jgi:beta-glucanase (GH16 family)
MSIQNESSKRAHGARAVTFQRSSGIAVVLACLAAGCSETMGVPPGPGSGGAGGGAQAGGAAPIGGAAGTGGVIQTGGAAGIGGASGTTDDAGGIDATDGAASDSAASDGAAADVKPDGASTDAGSATDARDADANADSATDGNTTGPGCPQGVVGHCTPPDGGYPTYPGFTLKLVEEFDQPIDLVNDPIWTYSDGFGENRYTRFVKQAITFTDGNAVITATNDGVVNTGYPTYADGELAPNFPAIVTGTTTVKSGDLRTKYQNWRYGRFEARTKAAKNVNSISCFFTWRSPKWVEWRDLRFEITPANAANAAGTNITWGHNAAAYGGTSNSYSAKTITTLAGGATIYDDFHTYAFENLPTSAKWFVDGTLVRTETGTGVKLPELSMKILLFLYVFPSSGWGGGNPAANTYPMSMQIDWVRLYKSDADTIYPCSPLPSCQPAGDRPYQKNNAEDGLPAAAPW